MNKEQKEAELQTRRLNISETSGTTSPVERNLRAFGALHRGHGKSVTCMYIYTYILFCEPLKLERGLENQWTTTLSVSHIATFCL